MNKCSGYILKHILSFIRSKEINLISRTNKTLKHIIYDDIRYKVNKLYHQWIHNLSLETLRDHGDQLDIVRGINGKYMFVIINLDVYGISLGNLGQKISVNSSLFIDFCQMMNSQLSIEGPNPEFITYPNISDYINHKYLVSPCRIHDIDGVDCYEVKLHYYKYLEMKLINEDGHYDHIIHEVRLIVDFYHYLTKSHSDLVKENTIYILQRSLREIRIAESRCTQLFFSCDYRNYDIPPDQTKEVLDKRFQKTCGRTKEKTRTIAGVDVQFK